MALHIVGLANLLGLIIIQCLDTAGGFPGELDIGALASFVHHLKSVHAKALHVTPVCGDAPGSQQPEQLQLQYMC